MRISDWSSDVCSSDLEDSGSARFGAERAQAINAARRALAIDPRNAAALTALSQTGSGELSMVEALPLVDRALAVDPEYPAALMRSAAGLFMAGHVRACVDPALRPARPHPTLTYKALLVVRRSRRPGYMAEK